MATGMDYSLVQRIIDGLGKILDTKPGSPDEGTYVTEQQLANWIKGQTVVPAYYYNGVMYSDALHTTPIITGQAGALYMDQDNNVLYRWDGAAWDAMSDEQLRQDILDGTVVAKKAECDEDGNNIKATYATKVETSNLQSQIVNINSEVDNIEALIGDEAQVENVDDTPMVVQSRLIHHANLLPNGDFGRVGARSVAFNQMVDEATYIDSNTVGAGEINGITITYDSSTHLFHATGTASANYDRSVLKTIMLTSGRKYFMNCKGIADGSSANVRIYLYGTGIFTLYNGQTNTANASGASNVYFYVVSGQTVDVYFSVNIFDLTAMNLASLTASEFRSLFPASYYPYNAGSIYDLNPSGFLVRGVNLWDEEWEEGALSSDGSVVASGYSNRRTTSFIRIDPDTAYFQTSPTSAYNGRIAFYDADKNFVYFDNNGIPQTGLYTSPQGACFMRVTVGTSYGTTYNHDIQFCLYSLPTAIRTVYHPYEGQTVDTPQISDGHYVNENCYDYVENVVEDGVIKGKKHKRVGSYTFDGTETVSNPDTRANGDKYFTITLNNTNDVKGRTGSTTGAIVSDVFGYANTSASEMYNGTAYGFYYHTGTDAVRVCVSASVTTKDQCIAWLVANTPTIYYELKTEVVSDCEPLRSFGISDYSTVDPVTPQTELINRIDVPFSVKTISANAIIEQVHQNTADISNLNNAISQIDHRVQNLEQAHGSYVVSNYKDGAITPSGKGNWAVVEGVRGVSRVENNLLTNGDFHNGNTGWSPSDGTLSVTDGVGTFTPSSFPAYCPITNVVGMRIAGHSYLCVGSVKRSVYSADVKTRAYFGSGNEVLGALQNTTLWQTIATVGTCSSNGSDGNFGIVDNSGTANATEMKDFFVTDLNIYFGTSDLSFLGATDSAKLATIQTNYPFLLLPSEYGQRIVDSSYTGVRAVGVNIWDEEWEVGRINDTTGQPEAYANTIRSKNFIPVVANQEYYVQAPTIGNTPALGDVYTYDANKNYLGIKVLNNHKFDTGASIAFIKIRPIVTYGNVYNHDIQICLNSYADKTTYHPYMTDTLSLTFQGKSAGSVSEMYYPETGECTHPLKRQAVGTGWVYRNDGSILAPYFYKDVSSWGIAFRDSTAGKNNIMLAPYVNVERIALQGADMVICTDGSTSQITQIEIKDSRFNNATDFSNYIKDFEITYEPITPDPSTFVTPIIDNTLLTESGGRMATVQTGTVVDGSFDLGFINL